MGTKTESGFTVIEVMLFLGVSGMLLIGILVATGSSVANLRFTDSMKGLESYVQRQYEEVVNGVNPRIDTETCSGFGSSRPGAGNCLLLGKVLVFTPNDSLVHSYYVIGTEPIGLPATNLSASQALTLYNVRVLTTNTDRYEIPWESSFAAGKRASDGGSVDAIAYLRSPISSQIETYIFKLLPGERDVSGLITTIDFDRIVNLTASVSVGSNAWFCVAGVGSPGQYRGQLNILRGQGAGTIEGQILEIGEVSQC